MDGADQPVVRAADGAPAAAARVIPAAARRVQVGPERLAAWFDGLALRHGDLHVDGDADLVQVTAADGCQVWIDVPFAPMVLDGSTPPDVLGLLCAHVQQARTVGVVLVRRGGYAAGVFAGTDLLEAKVGTSYVQGTTKAGGWSQQRYARRRANQSRAAFASAADVAVRILLPRLADLDAVVGGGDRSALDAVLADVRLRPLAPLLRAPLLSVPDPRLRVLTQTPEQFRAVRMHIWP